MTEGQKMPAVLEASNELIDTPQRKRKARPKKPSREQVPPIWEREDSNYCGVDVHSEDWSHVALRIYTLAMGFSRKAKDEETLKDGGTIRKAKHEADTEERFFYRSLLDVALKRYCVNLSTTDRGIADLVNSGFFELLYEAKGQPSRYKVLSHEQWAKIYPGKCLLYVPATPWVGDPLGRRLHQLSAGRATFSAFQLLNLRGLELLDPAIEERFTLYMQTKGGLQKNRNISWGFFMDLRDRQTLNWRRITSNAPQVCMTASRKSA
jgi:hypothetical protein